MNDNKELVSKLSTLLEINKPNFNWNKYGGIEEVAFAYIYGYRNSNISVNKYTVLNKELFPEKSSNTRPINYFLNSLGKKLCRNCSKIKDIDLDFRKNNSMADGVQVYCLQCHQSTTTKTQAGRQAKYKTSKSQRTPPWANLEKVKEIYKNCPEGYHVDHIIPLNGVKVSGLHVENNLQYLLAKDNMSKGNKYSC